MKSGDMDQNSALLGNGRENWVCEPRLDGYRTEEDEY